MGDRHERRRTESRRRILDAALDTFRRQGVGATRIEDICEVADVAPRTFFNHFPKREDLLRALGRQRMAGLAVALEERRQAAAGAGTPASEVLLALFDEIADHLEASGPTYRELVGAMLALTYGSGAAPIDRSSDVYAAFADLIKAGVAAGEVPTAHDPLVLADIVCGTLTAILGNWTADDTFAIRPALHAAGVALADLLQGGHR